MKTKIFSYYLQKLAEEEQKLLGGDNKRAAFLALILTRTHCVPYNRDGGVFSEEQYFCDPRFVWELFVYICLRAKENGRNLLSLFNVKRTVWHGWSYLEDKDITRFLDEVFPKVRRVDEDMVTLYTVLLPEIAEQPNPEWMLRKKFFQNEDLYNVNLDVLCPIETSEETALVDAALAELKDDEVFQRMLSRDRYTHFHKSAAYFNYYSQIENENFPKGD